MEWHDEYTYKLSISNMEKDITLLKEEIRILIGTIMIQECQIQSLVKQLSKEKQQEWLDSVYSDCNEMNIDPITGIPKNDSN